jgi:hypothetical protein
MSEPTGSAGDPRSVAGAAPGQLSEEELRAAYEEELSRITAADLALQAAVSLLNLGGRRLGLPDAAGQSPTAERDLDQVRDAIDGVRALLEILERRRPNELGPLRDALSQLQMAYAREAGAARGQGAGAGQPPARDAATPGQGDTTTPEAGEGAREEDHPRGPGPAESSGRLWVPGR